MKSNNITPGLWVIMLLIGLAALSRLIPHMNNFTPIGAIALFSGAYITNRRLAFLVPILTLFISDVLLELFYGIGFYRDMIFVYCSFMLIVGGGFLLRNNVGRQTVMVASLVSSVLFFLVTNFGTWLMWDIYPSTSEGLLQCYVAAIPFFKGTLMGDLFYNLLLFGSFALARMRYPVLKAA